MYRHISKGAWTFSHKDDGWQVSDCTAECLKVLTTWISNININKVHEQHIYVNNLHGQHILVN